MVLKFSIDPATGVARPPITVFNGGKRSGSKRSGASAKAKRKSKKVARKTRKNRKIRHSTRRKKYSS